MQRFHRLIGLLITFCVVASMLPTAVFATEATLHYTDPYWGTDLLYTINDDDTITITGRVGPTMGNVFVPEEINGLPVVEIAPNASLGTVKSVYLPKSLKSIGYRAFDFSQYNTSYVWDVYYAGTLEDAENLTIGSRNDELTGPTWNYNCDVYYGGTDFIYTVEGREVSILNGRMKTNTVPDNVNGMPITHIKGQIIDVSEFGIPQITLPSTVKTIAPNAFENFENTKTII